MISQGFLLHASNPCDFSGDTLAMRSRLPLLVLFCVLGLCSLRGADWTGFRGPGGLGTSAEKNLPVKWSSHDNIVWKTKLPGPGTSSPVSLGNRIFLTCYTGYAVAAAGKPGNMNDLRRHLLCIARDSGKVLWTKEFEPLLP